MTFLDFAQEHGITICSHSIPPREGYGEESFNWFVVLTTKEGKQAYSGEYSMGSAHAEFWAREGFKNANGKIDQEAAIAWGNMHSKPHYGQRMTVHDKQCFDVVRTRFSIKGPDIQSVLESLQTDMRNCDQDFEDWAQDFGYDEDSREAERVWQACRTIRRTFKKAVGYPHFERFMDIWEE